MTKEGESIQQKTSRMVEFLEAGTVISSGLNLMRSLMQVTTVDHNNCRALLQKALDDWPEFKDDEEPVNGGDLVEWFGQWYEQVEATLRGGAEIKLPPIRCYIDRDGNFRIEDSQGYPISVKDYDLAQVVIDSEGLGGLLEDYEGSAFQDETGEWFIELGEL